MSNYCDITVLLDRSGSMSRIKDAMESGFEEFLTAHREVPTTRLSLIQFDDKNRHDVVYSERPVTDAPKLDLSPRGMTPLRDALCMAIDEAGKRLARKKEADRPNKVLFVVITDGLENASKAYSTYDVSDRVKRQTDRYSWEFTFLGANQDAVIEGVNLGFDLNKSMTFAMSRQGVGETFRLLARNTANYAGGATAVLDSYTMDDRLKAMTTDTTTGDPVTGSTTDGTTKRSKNRPA